MHDNIACVDQHPIARILAFGLGNHPEFLLDPVRQLFSHCRHLTARTTGCDDHIITDLGLAAQIDLHDVLALIVIKRFQNSRQEAFAGHSLGRHCCGSGFGWCPSRCRKRQFIVLLKARRHSPDAGHDLNLATVPTFFNIPAPKAGGVGDLSAGCKGNRAICAGQ